MGALKQGVLAILVLAAGLFILIRHVPSSHPTLTRLGVFERLEALGITMPPTSPGTAQAPGPGGFGARGPVTVIAAPPMERVVNDRLGAIGNGQAARSVTVVPEVSGRVVEVLVGSGERLTAGQVIARLDDEAERIAMERATLVLADARERNDRVTRLQGSGVATDIQIREADLALQQAELMVRQAEFDLARRAILAPIDGWAGFMNAEVGKQVSGSTEITRIDDRSSIMVEFRVPERFVGLIGPGDLIEARPLARVDTRLDGRVSAIDNRVEPASRTLLVQARLDNAGDDLRAGMAFAISVSLPGEVLPAVDPLSVQWNSDGAFVWVVREGLARRVPIRIVQRSADAVLVRAEFLPGDQVVIEGVQALRPGSEVAVQSAVGGDGGRLDTGGGKFPARL